MCLALSHIACENQDLTLGKLEALQGPRTLKGGDTGHTVAFLRVPASRAHSHQTGSGASGSDRGEHWDPGKRATGNRVECGGMAETPRLSGR